jgi:hypothetical protein
VLLVVTRLTRVTSRCAIFVEESVEHHYVRRSVFVHCFFFSKRRKEKERNDMNFF